MGLTLGMLSGLQAARGPLGEALSKTCEQTFSVVLGESL